MEEKETKKLGFFRGRYGQRRRKADHTWYWDRQGIHTALGLDLGILPFLACLVLVSGPAISALLVLGIMVFACAVAMGVFVVYERDEDAEINDESYHDIGSALTGYVVGLHIGVVALCIEIVMKFNN